MRRDIYILFLQYLQEELSISEVAIEHVISFLGKDLHLLPIALWQNQLLTINQLDQAYDWLAITMKDKALGQDAVEQESLKKGQVEKGQVESWLTEGGHPIAG